MITPKELSHIKKTFVKQHGECYCGLACLASIVRYYGGEALQENLASSSGTTLQGTSMLGLYHTARTVNLDAKGFEADIKSLKELSSPVILHVLMEEKLQH